MNRTPVKFLFSFIILSIAATSVAFAIQPLARSGTVADARHMYYAVQQTAVAVALPGDDGPEAAEADSIEFNVEVVQPRKFMLSFTKKREGTFFIRIYDIIGNLIHHEVVSKKGRFRKHYDLSKYKGDLYVIEVGSGKKAKVKRLFLG